MARIGLPKWAIKEARKRKARNVFAYAWSLVKRRGKTRKRSTSRASNPKKRIRRRRNLPRRRRRRRGGKSLQRTIEKLLSIGVFVAPAAAAVMQAGTWEDKLERVLYRYSGYSFTRQAFEPMGALQGWGPWILFNVVSKGAHKINAILRRI